MYDGMFQVFSYTRNGIFLVPIFLMIGVWFAKVERENTVQNDSYWEMSEPKRWNRKRAGLGLLISLVLMTVEGFALHAADWQRHDSMYVMLPIVMDLCQTTGTIKKTAQPVDVDLYFTSGGNRGSACIAGQSGKRNCRKQSAELCGSSNWNLYHIHLWNVCYAPDLTWI